jgi:hypothetical protein
MAIFTRYIFSVTLRDGVSRDSVVSYYVLPAEAQFYFDAADQAGRLATGLGILGTRVQAMSDMALVSVSCSIEDLTDPVALPAVTVLRGNKLAFSTRAGGRGLTTTLPGRKPASFVQGANSLEVSLTTPTAMSNWVASIASETCDQFENPQVVESGSVVD